jgi:hypothetical protein
VTLIFTTVDKSVQEMLRANGNEMLRKLGDHRFSNDHG